MRGGNLPTSVDNSSMILDMLHDAVVAALDEIGKTIVDSAKDNVPRKTGVLADSITHIVDDSGYTVTVGSNANYAGYVELGTGPHYTAPPGWIRNTAQRGHHTEEPWWYYDDRDEQYHIGGFVTSRPFLQPAVTNNVNKLEAILKNHLKNA